MAGLHQPVEGAPGSSLDSEEALHPFVAKLVIGRRVTDGQWIAWEVGSDRLHGPFRSCQAAAAAGAKAVAP